MWWKERTNSHKMSSDAHVYSVVNILHHTPNKYVIVKKKKVNREMTGSEMEPHCSPWVAGIKRLKAAM